MILVYTAVADLDLQIRLGGGGGGGHSNPDVSNKIFFSVSSKNKGGVLGPSCPSPESATAL